jgi:Peptidase M50B-like
MTAPTKPKRPLTSKPAVSREELASNARWALIISTLATAFLYQIPGLNMLAYPLMLLSTLVHEMGHGVGALLAGGTWVDFHMFADGSGYARAGAPSDVGTGLTCAAGLVGPAFIAALYLVVGLRPKLARIALAGTGLFFVIALGLWVRGSFGMAFVTGVAAVCLAVALFTSAETSRLVLLFLATQLALSAYSRGDYLFDDYVDGQMSGGKMTPSDVQIMSDSVGGPYWLWGILCGAFSVAVIVFGAWLYLRTPKKA